MSDKLNESQFKRETIKEVRKRRLEKDLLYSSFIWLLFIELILAIGFPLSDLRQFLSNSDTSSLSEMMRSSLGYAFLLVVVIGSLISGLALYRLKAIKLKPEIRGRKLYQFGLYLTGSLLLLLGIIWIIISV